MSRRRRQIKHLLTTFEEENDIFYSAEDDECRSVTTHVSCELDSTVRFYSASGNHVAHEWENHAGPSAYLSYHARNNKFHVDDDPNISTSSIARAIVRAHSHSHHCISLCMYHLRKIS